jgi:lipopolysaccharide export system protein LptA
MSQTSKGRATRMGMGKSVMVTRISKGAALVIALAFTVGCTPGSPRGNDEVPPELTFQTLSFRVYRGPVLVTEGTATQASLRRDTADVTAQAVVARIPPAPGHDEARLRAARIDGNSRSRRFVASGGVHAEQAGQVADTEAATYDAIEHLVHGDRRVVLRRGGMTVTGAGFTLDPREQRLRLEGGTRAVAGGGRR